VGGLWLLQESLRAWTEHGRGYDMAALLAEAEALPAGGPVVDVDDPVFLAPGDMPDRIATAAASRGHRRPATPAETVRCVIDSLAASFADTVHRAAELAHAEVDVVHTVGGGAQNALLCQLTANAAGVPVAAGPIEATALGNVLVQARTHGALGASLEDIRSRVARLPEVRRFEPLPARSS
jgi:rhamnulokinase